MIERNLIFGLDEKISKIISYCNMFLESEEEFEVAKDKLSIIPTFLFMDYQVLVKLPVLMKYLID